MAPLLSLTYSAEYHCPRYSATTATYRITMKPHKHFLVLFWYMLLFPFRDIKVYLRLIPHFLKYSYGSKMLLMTAGQTHARYNCILASGIAHWTNSTIWTIQSCKQFQIPNISYSPFGEWQLYNTEVVWAERSLWHIKTSHWAAFSSADTCMFCYWPQMKQKAQVLTQAKSPATSVGFLPKNCRSDSAQCEN